VCRGWCGWRQEWGVKTIKLVTFVASPEGIKAFEEEHPDVDIVTCAIDEGLGLFLAPRSPHPVLPACGHECGQACGRELTPRGMWAQARTLPHATGSLLPPGEKRMRRSC